MSDYNDVFGDLASRPIVLLRPLPAFMPQNILTPEGCVILSDYLKQVQPYIERQLLWCQSDAIYQSGLPLHEFAKVYAVVQCTLKLLATLLHNVAQHRHLYLLDYRDLHALCVRVRDSVPVLWQEVQQYCTMHHVPTATFQTLVAYHSNLVNAMDSFITKHLVHIGATRCLIAITE